MLGPWLHIGLVVILAVASSSSWPRVHVTDQPMSAHHGTAVVCGSHVPAGLAAWRSKDHSPRTTVCADIFTVQLVQMSGTHAGPTHAGTRRLLQHLAGPPRPARAPPAA